MNAREKVWAWIETHRHGAIVHCSAHQIAEDTGLGQHWVSVILEQWHDAGDVERVRWCCRRIMNTPSLKMGRGDLWSLDREQKLKELDGLPLDEIAYRLHTTSSAVAGKRWRMGLSRPREAPAR